MILNKETLELFGFNPECRKPKLRERVVVRCNNCGATNEMLYKAFLQKKEPYCRRCPEYSKKRSSIAQNSNKNRTVGRDYSVFMKDVEAGSISFTEISDLVGDDSSVCKWFNKRGLKSHFSGSLQQKTIEGVLRNIFSNLFVEVLYGDGKKRADFFIPEVGFIEYDGAGFWHKYKTDDERDAIRLNAQAFFGGESFLRWRLKSELVGYCSVVSPKSYEVKELTKLKTATDMLENCHPLGNTAGMHTFGLFYGDMLIGVAKWGNPTNRHDNGIELRRFFCSGWHAQKHGKLVFESV